MLIINKVDLLRAEQLLPLSQKLNEMFPFTDTFMVSALTGSGVETLRKKIASMMPVGPWHYPGDQAGGCESALHCGGNYARENLRAPA